MKYRFVEDRAQEQHGWVEVYDEQGMLLAREEVWCTPSEYNVTHNFARMESHNCIPGQMIPSGDPRWYTHCQWCGLSVEGQETAYYQGQYHWNCYDIAKPYKRT